MTGPLLAALCSTAWSAPTHDVEAALGATYYSRTDLVLSPRAYHGVLPRLGLGYRHRGARTMHTVEASLSKGSFRDQPDFDFTFEGSDRTSGPSVVTMVDLRYAVGHRFDLGAFSLHVGATNANHIEDLVQVYGWMGVSNYLGAFELGPWVDGSVSAGERHTFGFEAWTPALAWMGRNPYPVHSGQHIYNTRKNNPVSSIVNYIGDGSLRTVNTYQAGHLRLRWTYAFGRHFALSTRVRLDALHYAEPRSVVETQAGLDLALQGRF